MSKAEIRRQLRARRNALSLQERTAHAEAAAAILTGSRYWRDADTIAVYLAADGELEGDLLRRDAERIAGHFELNYRAVRNSRTTGNGQRR